MPTHHHPRATLQINRAPVLTLWAAVVAERLGFTWDEALWRQHPSGARASPVTPRLSPAEARGCVITYTLPDGWQVLVDRTDADNEARYWCENCR